MESPVFMYYKLSNFYQNHRRYVKSYSSDQLKGNTPDYGTVQGGDCKPLDVSNGKIIYPCGLIANSVFNGKPNSCMIVHVGHLIPLGWQTPIPNQIL